jgi:nucleotide-binding universal stress UspA family protein
MMQRFRQILVVLDQPAAAGPLLGRAVDLARRCGARLTLVVEPGSGEGWLQGLAAGLGHAADLRVLPEPGAVGIVREVLRHGHDLVIKAAVVEHGLLTHLRTSIDEHLLRECPSAVWLDRPDEHPDYERILAAIEPEPRNLAAAVLEVAVGLAEIEQAQLHVVHVWELEGESAMRGRAMTHAAEAEIDAMVAEERARHAAGVEILLTPHLGGPVVPQARLEKGQPDIVIPQLVEALGIDLLVMGSLARRGLAGLLMGNTAEDVLAQTRCSLLALKPDDYVSPISLDG